MGQVDCCCCSQLFYLRRNQATSGWLAGTSLAGNSVAIGAVAGAASGVVGGAIASGTIKGSVKGAFAGALLGGVAGFYGNTYSLGRVATESLAGGITSEIYGQEFKDGLLFGALISSATYLTVRLRAYQLRKSKLFPGQIGESPGFRGLPGKVAGERIFEKHWLASGAADAFSNGRSIEWIMEYKYTPYIKAIKNISPLGGLQGGNGTIFGFNYEPGGFLDYVLEGYSGVHDSLNQTYFYTAIGTNRNLSGFWQRTLGYVVNSGNVLLSTPVVLPALIPDHLRYLIYQEKSL